MKKLIQLSTLFLLAGFILSSCSSNLSITKRRYTKGYFVQHHSGKHHVAKQNETKNKVAVNEPEKIRAVEYVTRNAEKPVISDKKEPITAAAPQKRTYTKEQKKEMRAEVIDLAVNHPVKAFKKLGDLTKQDSGDKALSLLWIVIV